MKKITLIVILILLTACGDKQVYIQDEVIEISEKLFIAQINEIYLNAKDYLGKTIKIEGIFEYYFDEELNDGYGMVYRNGPGCCIGDDVAGIEVAWSNEYPEDNSWVEAIGTLVEYDIADKKFLRLDLTSLKTLKVRGSEYVTS